MKNLRSCVAGTILCGLLASPVCAWADPVTRASVEGALRGYEQSADLAAVRAWGAPGAAILMEISRDPDALLATRARALHSLRAFGTDLRVRDHLRATAAAPAQDLFLLRASLDALIEGFGDVSSVSRYLSDARSDVRDGAVWSLASSPDSAARAALRDRLRVEPDPGVRATIAEALSRPSPVAVVQPVTPPAVGAASVATPSAPRAARPRRARSR